MRGSHIVAGERVFQAEEIVVKRHVSWESCNNQEENTDTYVFQPWPEEGLSKCGSQKAGPQKLIHT